MTHRIRTALALAAVWALMSTPPSRAGQLLYVSNFGNNTVSQIDSAGNVSTFASSGLSFPSGLAFDAAGNLYVTNTGDNTVSEFSATGASKGTFASGLSDPIGLAFDAAGNLYVANNVAGTVSEFSATGTSMGTFASGLSGPEFLAFAPTLSAVPEPGALTLAGIGLVTLLGYGRLRCRRAAPAP
jgi:DNA-binding beta-propeller fold protein YncE